MKKFIETLLEERDNIDCPVNWVVVGGDYND